MINEIIFYIGIALVSLSIIIFIGYLLFSQFGSLRQKNSLNITKKQFTEIFLKRITKKEIKPIIFNFFSPRMGNNKIYYLNKIGWIRTKWKLSLTSLNKILKKEKLFFRISKYNCELKRIWNIAESTEEVIGSTYVFTKKRWIIFLFTHLTFLLAAFGALWPVALGFTLNYGIRAIINDNFANNGELFISSLLLLASILSGTLSIMMRQIYVYKKYLRLADKIDLSQEEIKKIKKIIFYKIFFSVGMIIFLPLDFIKELSQSLLFIIIVFPFYTFFSLFFPEFFSI